MNLLIIGNGFDLAHGLPTSYEDFHKYLRNKYPYTNCDEFIIPCSSMNGKGEEIYYDDNEIISFILFLISNAEGMGEEWNDFENSLGLLDFNECFEDVPEFYNKAGDLEDWQNANNIELAAINLVPCISKIDNYFSEWIRTIIIGQNILRKPELLNLIDKNNDVFLTFNYTNTLELVYEAKNVYHIHGEQNGEIIFGHGNNLDYIEEEKTYIGSEDSLQKMHDSLKKDTKGSIEKNHEFFSKLTSSITKIYSYGFSFSPVDEIYIKEICSKLPTESITWYLNNYDEIEKINEYKKTICSCGFNGSFELYSI
ncbi:hypothetical protein GH808_02690 [Acetobacterium fimetarium]|uniref:Bacteriophage abortive infection AbiH n=1 Tax=Acetobacterium fimetarium TaxID=52691 RepID=A0ABR6WRX8_9FIRM|nr:bacteriophage abortive infection AbiH family protein [Acetobacterium fimetarium]MBC3803347.1 hypothetical protein [Acetobacterium fimetarium]